MKRAVELTIVALTWVVLGAASTSAQQVVNLSDVGPAGSAIHWVGPQANARAGASLLRADMSGDVDRVDLVVGAPGAGPNGEGQTYILFMGPTYASGSLIASASSTLTGESNGDQFGAAIAAGMIIRPETQPLPPRDLLVSAPAAFSGRGVVYLFPGQFTYGDQRAASAAPFRIVGAAGDRLGSAMVAADMDGDGYRDIVMSAPGTGRIYIVFGGPSLSGTRDLTTTPADVTITLPAGSITLAAADFNVDGRKDLAVGMPSSGAGSVALIVGKARASFAASFPITSADAQFTGIDAGDQAGAAVQAADFDGDGVTDLVIGAPGANGPSNGRAGAGEVYVLWGKSSFAASRSLSSANVTIYGAQAGNHLGAVVAAGKIRRDLQDDLLLLAPGASAAGDIDVVYGGARPAASVDLASGIDRVLRGDPANPPLQSIAMTQVTGKGEDIVAASPLGSANGMTASGSVYAVLSPTLQLDPLTTAVTVAQGATANVTLRIRNIGSLNIGWGVRTNVTWLTMAPSTGTTSAASSGTITLSVTPGSLPPGTYHGGFSYLSSSRDLVWIDAGSVDLTVTAGSCSGCDVPRNLFGLPSDPDEGSPNGVNTPVGTNVTVVPIRDFLVRFSNVTQAGRTRVDVQPSTIVVPGTRPTPWIYMVRTTAVFSGPVTVAAAYQNFSTFENDMRLLQGNTDVTTSVDTGIHAVYGSVASVPATLSPVEDRRRFVHLTNLGDGSGTLSSSPAATSCGDNCLALIAGTSATFTPSPASGSEFTGWGAGACATAGATCTLTMPSDRATTVSIVWVANRLVIPSMAVLTRPVGKIANRTPRFIWQPSSHAKSYLLWIGDPSGGHTTPTISAADAGCIDGVSACVWLQPTTLPFGAETWWVRASNGAGAGAWSAPLSFEVTTPDQAPPEQATPTSPTGSVSTGTPTYTWQAVVGATWYYVWVADSTPTYLIQKWYSAADAGCASGSGTCSITPTQAFGSGQYRWWIQTWNPPGFGPWSAPADFTIVPSPTVLPGKPILIAPAGSIATQPTSFSWQAMPYVQRYFVWFNDSSGSRLQQWYTATEAGCASGSGTCQVSSSLTLAIGAGMWWVQASNGVGNGPWSAPTNFYYAPPGSVPPGAATLVSPTGSTSVTSTVNQTYTWNAQLGSSWYYLWVNDSSGIRIQKWYTAAQSGCPDGTGTCSVTPRVGLAAGTVTWWIQTWNSMGFGPWSAAMTFSVTAAQASTVGSVPPPATTLRSPDGLNSSASSATQTYTWDAVLGATSYFLWVNDQSGNRIQMWYTADQAGCSDGTGMCSITPGTALMAGNAQWWIQAANLKGSGPWSSVMNFTAR